MTWPTVIARNVDLRHKHEKLERELKSLLYETRPDTSSYPPDLTALLSCIHERPFDPSLNVNAVKARCGIRNNNISTRFRSLLGIGIREYIEALRLEAAGRLLANGDVEVYLVAMAVGYDHQETFCRAFQRRFGHSPSAHRLLSAGGSGPREAIKRKHQEVTPVHG